MRGSKRIGALLTAAMFAIALGACGRDDTGASTEKAGGISSGPAKGEITVWAMGTEGDKLSVLAKDFEAANPGTTVKVTAFPWDAAHDKIATAIAGRTTPDISLVGTTWMGEYAKTGALDPVPSGLDKNAFFPGAWDTNVVNGTPYGVPWYVETRLIYYRTDLAQKAGVEPPTSWQGLKDFAAALKQKAGARWGINLMPGGQGSWQTFMPFAWQAGASITGGDGKQYTLDSPAMTKALAYYKSFFDEGLAPKQAIENLEQQFVDGQIGAFVSGPWHIGLLRDQGGKAFDGKWSVMAMPRERSGTSFVGGGNLVVFKDAKNRDAAWKFVQYLSRPEVQLKWYQTATDLPAVKSAWQNQSLAGDKLLATFGQQLNDAKSPPAVATWEQVANVVDTEIERVVKGGESPDAAAAAIQQKASGIGTGT
ncbi:MAG TPA: sugar ABC transporter substrate-binding protein [Actinomycetes bacterium]|nr:sugar ABC transporter substrate-binding protein [Actinomycetes bacterium]